VRKLFISFLLSTVLLASACRPSAQPLIFFSTQFKPVEEAERMRLLLKDAPVRVEYLPEDSGPFYDRLKSEQQAGRLTMSLIGGLHGDLDPLAREGRLEDLSGLLSRLGDRGFPDALVELSRLGTRDQHYYVPWMQASYVLAVNKKALQHLPEGADVNALSYAELEAWGHVIQQATGQRRLGLPGGPKGLLHRFFQGYLYPSYTGSAGVVAFKSAEAAAMWQEFKGLWGVSNPQSTSYEFMQEPLLAEEVWIAWDHTARLIDVVRQRPDEFVVVPAPAGPKGRGFMPVIAGLAIPKGAADRDGAEQMVRYLTQPERQAATLRELAFFPATSTKMLEDLPPGIKLEADAVARQAAAKDALPSLLPVGLGDQQGQLNKVYFDTFTRIVLRGEPIAAVLENQAPVLQAILNQTGAGCWLPDPPSQGPCQVQ
jgi:multiple sugar transport system substrate-binding protein